MVALSANTTKRYNPNHVGCDETNGSLFPLHWAWDMPCKGEENMVFHPPSRAIILLLFAGFLISIQLENVLGLRSSEIALRHSEEDQRILLQNQHTLKATEKELLNRKKNSIDGNNLLDRTKKISANVNNEFDPNQSNKRRVPRGSDPIHNRT
ncbi:hypothetical protein Fmac_003245 [Flemingia macrophylla]|uniref:CLAVATA3/ESR (CLE)-related protein 45 n=1 Tax=Flemingia macrophylla TaxID=520843 RepID=A0ABD1NM84_9FABA